MQTYFNRVNVAGDMVNGPKIGGDVVFGDKDGTPAKAVILLMSAQAAGAPPLRLDEERRAIGQAVTRSRGRDRLRVQTADAVRLDDLHDEMLTHRPVIAHFSGHGDPTAGIQVVDERGRGRFVKPEALSRLFGVLQAGLRCVVLNACHTREQATAIAQHVPCVIGMQREVLDKAAIQFSRSFYAGLAGGLTIGGSFDLALNGLDLHGFPDQDVPMLIARPAAAEQTVVTVP